MLCAIVFLCQTCVQLQVCDPSGDGIIECDEFLKAMLQADE